MTYRPKQAGGKSFEVDAAAMRVLMKQQQAVTSGTPTDHGSLFGLSDDDHSAIYVHMSSPRTITARHTFNPGTPASPFILGVNAADQLVTGLNADLLDGYHASSFALLSAGLPGTVTPDASAAAGSSIYAARLDHVHAITTAAPGAALSVSSTNGEGALSSFARSDHSHAITASSDVGTSPAASLLKSTPAGGLTLKTLTVLGAVDVAGGDLSVSGALGPNLLLVDYSQSNVGINCAPDPQFDLDVGGNIRAQGYFVGKHALQLDGALLIAHFDGPEPYQSNFTGEPNGHRGQPGTVTGGVIFRPGRFYKGAQIAEATTNKATNPAFSHSTWNTGWSTGADLTVTQNTDQTYILYGSSSARIERTGAGTGITFLQSLAAGNTNTHTLSAYLKKPDGSAVTDADIDLYGFGARQSPTGIISLGDGWYLAYLTAAGVAAATSYGVSLHNVGGVVYLSGMQLEEKPYPTPLAYGAMGSGHAWSGTAHASTSIRTAATLKYSLATLKNGAVGSFQAWVCPTKPTGYAPAVTDYDVIVECNYSSGGPLLTLQYTSTAAALALYGLTASAISTTVLDPGVWAHVCFTWDGSNVVLYVNGAQVGTAAQAASRTFGTDSLEVGSWNNGGQFNGVEDDFALIDRAMPADEVRAIYESNAPIFAETSTWHFRAANDLVWADSEGLWVKDTTGLAVLGVCGVDNKSWGGITLQTGDILQGRYGAADGGWLILNRDGGPTGLAQLSFGCGDVEVIQFDEEGASFNGVLDITSTGGIFQGTGTFASPESALKIYNNAGVGNIEMWGAVYGGGYAKQIWLTDRDLNLRTRTTDPAGALRFWYDGTGSEVENATITATDVGFSALNLTAYGPTNTKPGALVLTADSNYASSGVSLRVEGKGTGAGQTDGYAAVNLGLSTQKFAVNRGGAEKFSVDGDGLLSCASITTNGGTNTWDMAGFVASADAASNGYVTVTIDGVARKLMTRA